MSPVLGIDSSTQSTKALLVDASSGEILDQRRAAHPSGTQVDPTAWLDAMQEATAELLSRAEAVAVGGQQHGMIALDRNGQVVRNAMLWNDTSSAPQALELFGGSSAAPKLPPKSSAASSSPHSPARNCGGCETTSRKTPNAPRPFACRTTTSPGI